MTKTNIKPLPIILDRLAHALKAQGVKLKRSQLLEISAAAFGRRNSNELTAAAKAGDINPPPATPIGLVILPDGQRLVIMQDILANAAYAMDEAFLEQVAAEERREEIGITPYGHLAALYEVLDAENIPNIVTGVPVIDEVHVARVSHQHGENVYVAADDDGLTMQIAEYVRENWKEVSDYTGSDATPESMTDKEAVEAYFDLCQSHEIEEYLDTSVEKVMARIQPEVQKVPTIPDRYALQYEMDNEPVYIVDRHTKDGDGDYLTIAEIPRTNDPLEDISLANRIAGNLNGEAQAPAEKRPDEKKLLKIAESLEEGAAADIWYDAHEHMNEDNEEDQDTLAYNRICKTQETMVDAAGILRSVANGQLPIPVQNIVAMEETFIKSAYAAGGISYPAPTVNDDEAYAGLRAKHDLNTGITSFEEAGSMDEITDEMGDTTYSVTVGQIEALGLPFHYDDENSLPLTEDEYSVLLGGQQLMLLPDDKNCEELDVKLGGSVLYEDQKWYAPTLEFTGKSPTSRAKKYAMDIADAVTKAGGMTILHEDVDGDSCQVTVLIPFEHGIKIGGHNKEWLDAIAWLLTPESKRTGPQVIFTFIPECDINGNVVPVDPIGPDTWNGTFDALLEGKKVAEDDLSEPFPELDEYASSGFAPEWVRDWTYRSPYTVKQEGLAELFGLEDKTR